MFLIYILFSKIFLYTRSFNQNFLASVFKLCKKKKIFTFALSDIQKQQKMSVFITVCKKATKHNSLHYKPISITTDFSRVLEHMISNHIFDKSLTYNLIKPKRFKFLPHRSLRIQLLKCLRFWLLLCSDNIYQNSVWYTTIIQLSVINKVNKSLY